MKQAKTGVRFGSLMIAAAFCCGFLTVTAPAQEHAAAPSDAAKTLFGSRCELCHGDDGHGSDMGKSLKVKDLTSKEVQSQSDAELIRVISAGKNNMPPFKDALKEEEIRSLVQYIRTLK